MKDKQRLWIIPGIFFLIACLVNLYGCIIGNLQVERYVKGALIPLLSLTGLACLAPRTFDSRVAARLLAAQMFGWLGDTLLMGDGFIFFATGIGSFLLGHIFYISIFGRTLKGLKPAVWAIASVVMAGIILTAVLAIGIKGALLAPMAVYGLALLVISFSGLCGIVKGCRPSRGTWVMVLLGGLLFLGSDLLIAMRTFGEAQFALRGFTIMSTYLVAQSLLCAAAVRIALKEE